MKRTAKYVTLDVHQATTAASVREASGRLIARTLLPTEERAIVELFRGMRGAIHVAFEEGTQAQWLHELLAPRVDRVVVCDGRGERRQGNRNASIARRLPLGNGPRTIRLRALGFRFGLKVCKI